LAIILRHSRVCLDHRRTNNGFPNVARPTTINQKILWRKIFDRNPHWPQLQDKLAARDFVAGKCPGLALNEVLWIGNEPHGFPSTASWNRW
jgi:hypothetical protein